jgi:hypothetical protein
MRQDAFTIMHQLRRVPHLVATSSLRLSILVRILHILSFVLLIQIFIDLLLLDCLGFRFPCRDHSIDLGIRILGFVMLSLFIA